MDKSEWDERYRETGWLWSLTPNRFVAEHLADLEPGRALDLACGEGRNALWLAARGWRVTAVDFAEAALGKGRERAAEDRLELEWVAADLTEYVPEPGGYDLALIAYLHLQRRDLETVLRRAADALAPGGTLFVVGHDATNIADGVGGPQDPSVLYTPELLTLPLPLEALRLKRAERVTRPVDGASRSAIDTLVVAVRA